MNVNRQLTNKAGFTLRYNQIFRVWQKAVLFFIGESLAPPVALLILIKSAEYLFSPASSIQHLGRLLVERCCPNYIAPLLMK